MKFYTEQLCLLEDRLIQIDTETFIYKRAELAIIACQNCLADLRISVSKSGFKNEYDESIFFKEIKAKVVGYLYFYINLIELERCKPLVLGKKRARFFAEFISNLRSFFLEHREFYEYYLRGHTHKDTEFFCRKTNFPNFHLNSITKMVDANFNTSHDLILARIIGNTNTINYIRNQVFRKPKQKVASQKISNLKWTGAKVDLIELVYALQCSGVVNNGQAGIKELAENFETTFGIELGDIYRAFLEIRARKTTPTKLLDSLKISLINKMIQADA